MSVASLREELERELVAWALAGQQTPADNDVLIDLSQPLLARHLPVGSAVRLARSVLPSWYLSLWYDQTQLDGRAIVARIDYSILSVRAASPGGDQDGVGCSLLMAEFLRAVLGGQVGDSA